jgi:hypothetical protein
VNFFFLLDATFGSLCQVFFFKKKRRRERKESNYVKQAFNLKEI